MTLLNDIECRTEVHGRGKFISGLHPILPLEVYMPLPLGFSKVLQCPNDPLGKEQVAGKVKICHTHHYIHQKLNGSKPLNGRLLEQQGFFPQHGFLDKPTTLHMLFTQPQVASSISSVVPRRDESKNFRSSIIYQISMANHLTRSDFGWHTTIK